MDGREHNISDACLGLPLEQALSLCKQAGIAPQVVYTGERSADAAYTVRVVAVKAGALIVSPFKDSDPRQPEEKKHE